MSKETLVMITDAVIVEQLSSKRGRFTATTKKGKLLDVRAIIDGEAYVSVPNSDTVFKLCPKQLAIDSFVAQGANKKLTKGLVKKPSTLVYHNGEYYQCVTENRQYRPLTDKTNIVG